MINYPVKQGVLLRTKTTEKWSPEERRAQNDIEQTRIYCDFTALDDGKSRRLIATCEDSIAASELVTKLNQGMKALDAIRKIQLLTGPTVSTVEISRIIQESLL